MNFRSLSLSILCIALGACSVSATEARAPLGARAHSTPSDSTLTIPSHETRILAGAVALPPSGFVEFCRRHPGQCRPSDGQRKAGPAPVSLRSSLAVDVPTGSVNELRPHAQNLCVAPCSARDPRALDESLGRVLAVNAAVNAQIVPESDMDRYGVKERWSINVPAGDCEDYVLTKRAHLLAAGWESSKLRIATVRLPTGELHAVLVVSTALGDLVLDNLSNEIRGWSNTPYAWLTIQSEADPAVWQNVVQPDPRA